MTALAHLAVVKLVRNPARTVVQVLTLAAAVALLGSMVLFVGHSLRTMSASAVRAVPLDWQGPLESYESAVRVAARVVRQPGVLAAAPAATAPFAGIEHRSAAGEIQAGAGALLALPLSYARSFHTFRFLRGTLRPGEIVLDQQLAATLQAQIGDQIVLHPGRSAQGHRFRVSGVVLVTAPDVLFQPLDPLFGPAPAQPPSNIAILPLGTFARELALSLPAINTTTPAEPGTLAGTQWEVQAQADPRTLTGSPAHALKRANQIRNRVERSLPGQVQFVDNLAESLNGAAGDALYAETLYILLAIPGALVALGLAYLAALGSVDRDRRELALLRARGARRRDLLTLAAVESLIVGVVAGASGAALALLAVHLEGSAGGVDGSRAAVTFALCAALAFAGALATRLGTAAAAFRSSISESRRSVRRAGRPLWQRLYLDLAALAAAGLVYWLTVRTGFSAVVNPDSNPTLSLSVYMFFAPALLWIGVTLLLVRLRGRALSWLVGRTVGGRASSWRGLLLAAASRRGGAINRGLVVVGLLLAFGVELGLFTATYDQQARIDAQLTLGADVVITAPPGVAVKQNLEQRVAHAPGVAGVTGVDHSYAYVGPDMQDTYGIDASTFTRATSLRDSYFVGGTAGRMLARLRTTPDGVLVSRETITDYSLAPGDLLRLRLFDRAHHRLRIAPFHVVGVVQEFPSAPRDSFMVANRDYLERVTHDPGANVLFVKAKGDPVALSQRLAQETAQEGTLVRNIRQQTAQTVSAITTVSLSGISRIEEVFALVLAAAAMALFTAVGVSERRHELATMAALGAPLRRIAAFLWSEAALVVAAALALSAVLGWLLAEMLVAMLQHVFDPPPDHLAAPWGFFAGLGAAAIAGMLTAAGLAAVAIRRLQLGALLREE